MYILLNILLIKVWGLTTSGISSGGFFSSQFQVAFSSIVSGAGIIAGGPYLCSEGSESIATTACMTKPLQINMDLIYSNTKLASSRGVIDDISNLASAKVWIFSGLLDSVVNQGVVQKTLAFYQNFSPKGSLVSVFNVPAQHSWVTNGFGSLCAYLGSPFINNCNVDAAGSMLQLFYGTLSPRVFAVSTHLYVFNQALYGDILLAGMYGVGYVYIPTYCMKNKCEVHISFHGCLQSAEVIGLVFVTGNGLNDWAEANNIVVIYPQIVSTLLNPQGCWDFWGYSGTDFAYKTGRQMQIVYNMSQKVPIVNWNN